MPGDAGRRRTSRYADMLGEVAPGQDSLRREEEKMPIFDRQLH